MDVQENETPLVDASLIKCKTEETELKTVSRTMCPLLTKRTARGLRSWVPISSVYEFRHISTGGQTPRDDRSLRVIGSSTQKILRFLLNSQNETGEYQSKYCLKPTANSDWVTKSKCERLGEAHLKKPSVCLEFDYNYEPTIFIAWFTPGEWILQCRPYLKPPTYSCFSNIVMSE